jgi:hypothetical protein
MVPWAASRSSYKERVKVVLSNFYFANKIRTPFLLLPIIFFHSTHSRIRKWNGFLYLTINLIRIATKCTDNLDSLSYPFSRPFTVESTVSCSAGQHILKIESENSCLGCSLITDDLSHSSFSSFSSPSQSRIFKR